MLFFVLYVWCNLLFFLVNADCSTYGICKDGGKMLPCSYTGSSKTLDPNTTSLLRDICPQLPGIDEQIQNLAKNMKIPTSLLQKCPACLQNFKNIFCGLTCHPEQSQFLFEKSVVGKTVHILEYHITDHSARDIYGSCKDVSFLNSKVVYLMCGKAGKNCDYQKFFDFLGHNNQNPLTINFVFESLSNSDSHPISNVEKSVDPYNIPVTPCNEPVNKNGEKVGSACACKDCASACIDPMPVLQPDGPDSDEDGFLWWYIFDSGSPWRHTIAGMDAMIFIMTMCFGCFVLVFACALAWNAKASNSTFISTTAFEREPDALKHLLSQNGPNMDNDANINGNNNNRFTPPVYANDQLDGTGFLSPTSPGHKLRQASDKFLKEFVMLRRTGSPLHKISLRRKGGPESKSTSKLLLAGNGNTDTMNSNNGENNNNNNLNNEMPPNVKMIGKNETLPSYTNATLFGVGDSDNHDDIIAASQSPFQRYVSKRFRDWAFVCARYPGTILTLGFVTCIIMSCGLTLMRVTTDPVELWSSPQSRARTELTYFNEQFGPFYRIEQLILVPTDQSSVMYGDKSFGPVFRKEFLLQALSLQKTIYNIKSSVTTNGLHKNKTVITLSDICFTPLSPLNTNCTVQSLFQYYQNDVESLLTDITTNKMQHFDFCSKNPLLSDSAFGDKPCLSLFGGPINPWFVLGGFKGDEYSGSTALVITFVVNNAPSNQLSAQAWEKEFLMFMKNYSNPLFTVTYQAQRSIQDEIERESQSDVNTILISYFVMFLYISIALGHFRSAKTFLIDSKLSIGMGGVLIVLASVTSSLGTFSYIGIPATLIIMEVVPFLVLAVGIDNVFIMVHQCRRMNRDPKISVEQHVANVIGHVGPSMLLTSLSESIAFFLGAFSNMPAVQIFSLYAGLAVLYDFCLQVTCFVSLLTLDLKRYEANKPDIFCCFLPTSSEQQNPANKDNLAINASIENNRQFGSPKEHNKKANKFGVLYRWTEKYYAPFILSDWIRPFIMILFATFICYSAVLASRVHIGLDQKVSMPHDSYVLSQFEAMEKYLAVGPPVYFVLKTSPNSPLNSDGKNQLLLHNNMNYDDFNMGKLNFNPLISANVVENESFNNIDNKNNNNNINNFMNNNYMFRNMKKFPAKDYYQDYNFKDGFKEARYLQKPIVAAFNWTDVGAQNLVCGGDASCDRYSLVRMIAWHASYANISYLSPQSEVASWIDDYIAWSAPGTGCCRIYEQNSPNNMSFCPTSQPIPPGKRCVKCPIHYGPSSNARRIMGTDFYTFLPYFLGDIPNANCPTAGKAAYENAVKLGNEYDGILFIEASHFMTYHTVLKTSDDFVHALRHARILAKNITQTINARLRNITLQKLSANGENLSNINSTTIASPSVYVFPYSVFYVFYEQYLTMVRDAFTNLTICITAIFMVTLLCLAGLPGACLLTMFVTLSVASILLGLFAFMRVFSIELNAVSLVNAVMALGISVEFVSHMVRAFSLASCRINASLTQYISQLQNSSLHSHDTTTPMDSYEEPNVKNGNGTTSALPDIISQIKEDKKITGPNSLTNENILLQNDIHNVNNICCDNVLDVNKARIRLWAANRALVDTGSSVFSGIALTKLLGICVLAFSKSRIFSLYYFRMYLGVVILGTLQGLFFLPVLLSYMGPVRSIKSYNNVQRNKLNRNGKKLFACSNKSNSKDTDNTSINQASNLSTRTDLNDNENASLPHNNQNVENNSDAKSQNNRDTTENKSEGSDNVKVGYINPSLNVVDIAANTTIT